MKSEQQRALGLGPVVLDEKLCQACQGHANYMASTGDFSHYSNGGYVGRARAQGFTGPVQENIAAGQMSVTSVMNTWQASDGHYAAIVDGYNKCGFGLQYSSGGSPYWVALYGNDNIPPTVVVPTTGTYYPKGRLFRRR